VKNAKHLIYDRAGHVGSQHSLSRGTVGKLVLVDGCWKNKYFIIIIKIKFYTAAIQNIYNIYF